MNLIWYALWFVVAVSLLVTVHEFGHFWVARRLGFKVLRFAVGLGKPLVRRVAGADRVEYVIAAIPLGGYVKLLDEREGPVAPEDLARSFTRRPPWQRIVVLLAGPGFNILFAVLVLWGMFWASGVTEVKPVVGDLAQGSIAARAGLRSGDELRALSGSAGLKAGDQIVAIEGAPVRDFREIVARISAHPGETLAITYRRGGVEQTARVAVAAEEAGAKRIGRIRVMQPQGITYPASMLSHTDLTPTAALGRAGGEAWNMTVLQARLFWRMLLGQVSLKNLSGPLAIAEFAGDSAQAGVASFMGFLVLISLSLGFLNLLPIPILDGGQIVFQLVEWLKGSPLSERAQAFGQQLGIALLILLMGVALFNDLARQFS